MTAMLSGRRAQRRLNGSESRRTKRAGNGRPLIGGGIMSATLGTYLQELQPDWSMTMVERLDGVAQESSNGWNNAGTGHSALMELNYTPQKRTVPLVSRRR